MTTKAQIYYCHRITGLVLVGLIILCAVFAWHYFQCALCFLLALWLWPTKHQSTLLLLICAHLCPSVANAATFSTPPADTVPSPQSALLTRALRSTYSPSPLASRQLTNGQVTLLWTAGEAAQTVLNLSNQTATDVGMADIATIGGLPIGSTNTFVVTNSSGASNLATGVAQRGTNRITQVGSIQLYSVPLTPGRTNWLLTSSNLVTWTRSRNLGTNAGNFTFAVTNSSGPAQFFQTLAE